MLIRPQPTTLLQIFCEFMLTYEVTFKITIGPDDICQRDIQAFNLLKGLLVCWLFAYGAFPYGLVVNVSASDLSCTQYFFVPFASGVCILI